MIQYARHKLITAAVSLAMLTPVVASAQDIPERFQPTLDAFLAANMFECAALENGVFEAADRCIQLVADFNKDGITDPVIDTRAFSCSSSATLFDGGTGGHYIYVFVSGDDTTYQRFEFLAQDSAVVSLSSTAVLLLELHGTACQLSGPSACFAAYSWAEGKFITAGEASESKD
jgi:hypothetical protein